MCISLEMEGFEGTPRNLEFKEQVTSNGRQNIVDTHQISQGFVYNILDLDVVQLVEFTQLLNNCSLARSRGTHDESSERLGKDKPAINSLSQKVLKEKIPALENYQIAK